MVCSSSTGLQLSISELGVSRRRRSAFRKPKSKSDPEQSMVCLASAVRRKWNKQAYLSQKEKTEEEDKNKSSCV